MYDENKYFKHKNIIKYYYFILKTRILEQFEYQLLKENKIHFIASSKGHEGTSIFKFFLRNSDWICPHYRERALLISRGIEIEDIILQSLGSKSSMSSGRQMTIDLFNKKLNITSTVTPVGNNALHAVGIAYSIKSKKNSDIVYCSIGDGGTQQGEFLEAISQSYRMSLPILFVIHNNEYAISTSTKGKTFFETTNFKTNNNFNGVNITHINGSKPFNYLKDLKKIFINTRQNNTNIIIFNVKRLDSHSNADDQDVYINKNTLLKNRYYYDPVKNCKNYIISLGIKEKFINSIENNLTLDIKKRIEKLLCNRKNKNFFNIKKNKFNKIKSKDFISEKYFDKNVDKKNNIISMKKVFIKVFQYHLRINKKLFLFGQDIEDNKGDIFGITKGLSTKFPEQILNSPLSESIISGFSVGMSLTGKKIVAFIQFIDFIYPAFNQILSEISTMSWRTKNTWNCPIVFFVSCGGYGKGLGPFHSQTNESIFAHIPNIDIYCPSNAIDASGLLNNAILSKKPSIFMYPKQLLNYKINYYGNNKLENLIINKKSAKTITFGRDITIVCWGNTVKICKNVHKFLVNYKIFIEIIDIRTIKPFDLNTILNSVKKTKKLIVIHEDNIFCGMGAEIITSIIEKINFKIFAKRIATKDTYIPYNFDLQKKILPNEKKLISLITSIFKINKIYIKNKKLKKLKNNIYKIKIPSISPTDVEIFINKIFIKVGEIIFKGQNIVEIESNKSTIKISSPIKGKVIKIFFNNYEFANVNDTIIELKIL